MDFILDLIKSLIAKSPTRLVGYGSIVAVAIATWIAAQLHITLPPELVLGIGGLGAAFVTELIRRLVYSPHTVQQLADQAATTGVSEIGSPPDASPPLPAGEG